ncbi:MAG: hypothetical protein KAT37_02215 [Candidatus Aenigmarchaeota archaeon]|nr:hypothetical protein [Candidatus Aenigmarchaeota archaeon]
MSLIKTLGEVGDGRYFGLNSYFERSPFPAVGGFTPNENKVLGKDLEVCDRPYDCFEVMIDKVGDFCTISFQNGTTYNCEIGKHLKEYVIKNTGGIGNAE